uniref:Putative secreted protein n=1 Tax=Anopheles darlingi TaxID=43151 RepID=A0A2M4DFX5_ANODA
MLWLSIPAILLRRFLHGNGKDLIKKKKVSIGLQSVSLVPGGKESPKRPKNTHICPSATGSGGCIFAILTKKNRLIQIFEADFFLFRSPIRKSKGGNR